MAALRIRQDYSPSDLRQRAARERDTRASLRLLAIANALEGRTRAEAARLAGMERQALHDAIQRFNGEWSCFRLMESGFVAIRPSFRTEPD
jgi:RNA polymerase-interacting CarD/CdnL/TRCF family regulator